MQETKQNEIREKFEHWAINEMVSNKLPTWADCADWWLNEFNTLLAEDRAKMIEGINKIKESTQKQTGSFKYNVCYEECIEVIEKYK